MEAELNHLNHATECRTQDAEFSGAQILGAWVLLSQPLAGTRK
jgi:hypothetical protein